jgi:hypothetical protein
VNGNEVLTGMYGIFQNQLFCSSASRLSDQHQILISNAFLHFCLFNPMLTVVSRKMKGGVNKGFFQAKRTTTASPTNTDLNRSQKGGNYEQEKPIAGNQSVLDHGTIHPVFDHTIHGR